MIITRYHNTTTLHLTVEFLTPTFLGGADQHAELRAAPFKNLLRQWWRVAVGCRYNTLEDMRKAEGDLFGSVLDESNERGKKKETEASASKVRLALTSEEGSFSFAEKKLNLRTTFHPEARGGMDVDNALYLGFGPITYTNRQTEIKRYIMPGSKATLCLLFPKDQDSNVAELLHYIDAFGTIGSRSRNGWGSIALSGVGFQRRDARSFASVAVSQLFDSKQEKQYPSSLGRDNKGLLCWETNPIEEDWDRAMTSLAAAYMNLRTSINIKPQGLKERHVLGYPVTNHPVRDWDERPDKPNSGRMPSQLRLMVKRNQKNQMVGRILHLPHKLPKKWDDKLLGQEIDIWKKIHTQLDANKQFRRCEETR